ncbi:MAG: TIGR03435 family protein [Bryobacteraceae bacterium]
MPAYAYYMQAPAPAFEVATIKMGGPEVNGVININTGKILNGVVTLSNATLSDCLKFAYSLTTEEQLAGPDWIKDKQVRFEVTGKAAPVTPDDQLRLMLQTLLKERFQMTLHFEQREMTHYELVIGKNGPKLKESTVGPGEATGTARLDGIRSNRMQMNRLAALLSRTTRMPVLDKTGLTGFYQFDLRYANEVSPKPEEDPAGPSVFTAVQEQLGLKLESKKGPVEVLVVDRAERIPVEN